MAWSEFFQAQALYYKFIGNSKEIVWNRWAQKPRELKGSKISKYPGYTTESFQDSLKNWGLNSTIFPIQIWFFFVSWEKKKFWLKIFNLIKIWINWSKINYDLPLRSQQKTQMKVKKYATFCLFLFMKQNWRSTKWNRW